MRIKIAAGFTLLELAVTMAIMAGGLVMILMANTYSHRTGEAVYERMVATQDAHRTIEMMRGASSSGSFPANVTAAYPNGAAVAGFANLSGETVTVTYVDPAADPLDVTVITRWLELGLRNSTAQLRTLLTQRE